ncbi:MULTISPECIES: mersacidin/lichenicidin family type 2 lantibiotic [Myxococcus]|uniref:Mersacidin/lichenicidin family type 2 lantibiotic n=1 Tax=Myxococcus xanthus TaxID=34 RepID=A0AAE6FZ59_MYXXA|nr:MULTISPECIES: mersacidin/lichenicidin family type 2 lantibiotic [Myxococcus]QDE67953.1 mersacidin/lichenicidin family type 2 lantibiotic [Myxococcus xanthus]QDE75230.1 mersacidin/lichenicidin family type 2 lantibiotic [Myxococcus xanthus]QDE82531.1 mersacidin/lichenicidin family type 2 lantibiotic [Myxococcus xanthus]QDE96804.1 mersacidin/lichenicidin family type 2 lantibiotic [Myxococcus xanthus]QDF04333.1 mersacidin/lichenicidin family type 2 lantibiotic [Myxococcus xanthus]
MSQKKDHILRAWRDPEYFNSLTAEERAALPANPAAELDLGDDVLESITGGCGCKPGQSSAICTPCPPYHCL